MKCTNCGYEHPREVAFCPNCGSPMKRGPILKALKHPMFLVICILISCGCGFNLLGGDLSVIGILFTIFFWLTYAKGQKGIAEQKHLRSISGTFFASYVVNFVVFGAIAILGVLIAITLLFAGNSIAFQEFLMDIEMTINDIPYDYYSYFTANAMLTIYAIAIAGICLFLCAVGVVLNIVGYRKIHKFAQSVYLNVGTEEPVFFKTSAVRAWLIVFGVIYGISALSSAVENSWSFLGDAAYSAAWIVGSVWVVKHFTQNK